MDVGGDGVGCGVIDHVDVVHAAGHIDMLLPAHILSDIRKQVGLGMVDVAGRDDAVDVQIGRQGIDRVND